MGPSRRSSFETAKTKGNMLYFQACRGTDGMTPSHFRSSAQHAINSYLQALKFAKTVTEFSSVEKNLGVVHAKIAERFVAGNAAAGHCPTTLFYLKEALVRFQAAWSWGFEKKGQSPAWVANIEERIDSCAKLMWDGCRKSGLLESDQGNPNVDESLVRKQWAEVHGVGASMAHGTLVRARVFFHGGKLYFHEAVRRQEADGSQHEKHMAARNLLADAGQCVAEAEAKLPTATKQQANDEVEDLRASVSLHMCISVSACELEKGQKLMISALMDSETLDMDKVYDAMDVFRQAIVDMREQCLELEAEAWSHMGRVYDAIRCDPTKAKLCYRQSIELAHSLTPQDFTHLPWYQLATRRFREFQELEEKKAEKQWSRVREPLLVELKPVLAELKRQEEKGAIHLLAYIYKEHPPRREVAKKNKKRPDQEQDLKKRLRRALVDYHPDKNEGHKETDPKWVVLTEEITKALNEFYCRMKA